MTCKPVSIHHNTELGRAFFSVESGNGNVDLFCKNIYDLEKDESSSKPVQTIIGSIWDILQIPGCYVSVDILREVFNFKSNETFSDHFFGNDISVGKTTKKLHRLVKEKVFHYNNATNKKDSLLEKFVQSQLGILMLRHMIDLPGIKMKELEYNLLSEEALNGIENAFVKSPYCCFYVNDIQVDAPESKEKKYRRTRPIFLFERKNILQEEIECRERGKQLLPGVCYVFGSILSGYLGHTGNFYVTDEEFESRKKIIQSAWNNKEQYQKRNGSSYSIPKWYDSYAGAHLLDIAKYQAILSDAPPNSKYSTLSAMKRNLIILLYICHIYLAHKKDIAEESMEELLEDMAESVAQYFLPTSTKSPLKMSSTSKCHYLKCEESVLRPGMGISMDCWSAHLERRGLDSLKLKELETISCNAEYCYQNIKMLNCLSGREFSEEDRLSLSKQNKTEKDESESMAVFPIMLYSYMNTTDMNDKRSKVGCGMATQISPFQNSLIPLYICKSSFLYGNKKAQNDEVDKDIIGKDLYDIMQKVNMLCENGYSKEESYQLLSLSSNDCELINEILTKEDDEPSSKKMKTY